MSRDLPLTLAALGAGTLSWQHARVMCDEADGLDRAAAAAFEAHFLDPGAPNAAGLPGRGADSVQVPGQGAVLAGAAPPGQHRNPPPQHCQGPPAGVCPATAAARALQGPAEARTLTQLRVDVAAAWLLGPGQRLHGTHAGAVPAGSVPPGDTHAGDVQAGEVPSPSAQVLVTVPVFSLLGLTEEPATLDGAPLEIGRTSYRLTKPMRQRLRLRDARCTFLGCNNHSLDNDADHTLAWAHGGTTGISNLGQPCPKHHRLKHTTAWRPVGATRESPPGWMSPSGRSYPSEQQDWEPPTWPEPPLGQDCPDPSPWEAPDYLAGAAPDDLDEVAGPVATYGPEPPLPVDPWPDWASSTAG